MYKKHEHIHFMGIGGIGMSGIAEILRHRGYEVSGCDSGGSSKTLAHLEEIGCAIYHEHNACHIDSADVLVYSSAVRHDAQEVQAAREKGLPIIPRALMLAELMRTKYSVAVSGSHGKTTTTSLISHVMMQANKMPTVVVGGILKNIGGNAHNGNGEIFVAEADESDRSFLYLTPTMAVVTNISAEHLDTYKDLDDVKKTFKDFLARIPFYGKAFICSDDPNVLSLLPVAHVRTVKYGFNQTDDLIGQIVSLEGTCSQFDVYINNPTNHEKTLLGRVTLNLAGRHNVLNALATVGVCLEYDIPFEIIAQGLQSFAGVERRFEFKGMYKGTEVFDDYGHHPVEIKATMLVAQKRAQKNLHLIFQPHRFSRTEKLWDDFVQLFAGLNNFATSLKTVYVVDIYPASEKPIPSITSERLVQAIKQKNPAFTLEYVSSYQEALEAVQAIVHEKDLVLTLGAGPVNRVGEQLVQKLH